MAYGGGTFLVQNKVMSGVYINFVSLARAAMTLSDRGYAAIALELDWGKEDGIFTVEQEDFQENCSKYFGYDYTASQMKGLRDLFLNAKTVYCYRLNGGGVKASCELATAICSGTRGNSIKLVVAANVDNTKLFDVKTYFDDYLVDSQTVADAKSLVANDYVTFTSTATLAVTAGTALTGGTNGASAAGTAHSNFLAALEAYSINVLACLSTDDAVKSLYLAYTKRMRDDVGAKFQLVVYNINTAADYEGCINVNTPVTDDTFPASSAVYWVAGAEAACAVNRSVSNKIYDGEFTLTVDTKQSALIAHIKAGDFVFHQVDDEIRVLKDINSFISFTTYKNKDFALNQVIRVLDQIANDTASTFEASYLGKVQNNPAGRVALWNDLVYYAQQLQQIEAITDFKSEDITVEAGAGKEDVLANFTVTPVVAMEKLYMYVYVK